MSWQGSFFVQRQAVEYRCVGVEDQDADISLRGQKKNIHQRLRHAFVALLLPQLLGGDAFDVLQVGIGPGRGNHLDADRRAVWDPESDEQKTDRRGDVCKLCQVATRFFGDVRRTDFPASAVEASLKSQAPYNFPRVLSGVGIADVDGLPGIAAEDGVDHRADDSFGLALCLKVVADLLAFRDQREVVAQDAGKLCDLIVQKVCLAGMKEKIRKAVLKALSEKPDDENLRRQVLKVSSANIMTIDALCMSIVKDNLENSELDPNVRIADAAELKLLKADVMADVI